MKLTTWRREITICMGGCDESWKDLESCTLTDAELDEEFYAGHGGPNGKPFTLWTRGRVYFPATYAGSEWVDSAPRNPCGEAMTHVGDE